MRETASKPGNILYRQTCSADRIMFNFQIILFWRQAINVRIYVIWHGSAFVRKCANGEQWYAKFPTIFFAKIFSIICPILAILSGYTLRSDSISSGWIAQWSGIRRSEKAESSLGTRRTLQAPVWLFAQVTRQVAALETEDDNDTSGGATISAHDALRRKCKARDNG